MNKKVISIIFVFVFLLFVGIIDYPFVVRLYNKHVQGKVVIEYDENADYISEEGIQEELSKARNYNASLAMGSTCAIEDAFTKTEENNQVYESILNIGDEGMMAVIEIPKIEVVLPVYHGTSEDTLQKGAGHLEGSSFPVGGASTHACISAHRGLPAKEMFTKLDLLTVGDVFYIRVLDQIFAYKVYDIETVTPDQIQSLEIEEGKDRVTLITCTPYGINTHRLYVHGERILYEEGLQKTENESGRNRLMVLFINNWWIIVNVVLLLWMFILLYRFNRRGNDCEKKRN